MSVDGGDLDRHVLPRWHTFKNAVIMGEAFGEPRLEPKFSNSLVLQQKIKEWNFEKTDAIAVDLVGSSLLSGKPITEDAKKAAEYLLKHAEFHSTKLLAKQLLAPNGSHYKLDAKESRFRAKIALLKMRLKVSPHNAICWVDMAFYYAALGQIEKSIRSMEIALNLNSENRFVLRSAARLFVHADSKKVDVEKSLYFLRRAESIKNDPWLMASEVAISEHLEVKSVCLKKAFSMLKSERFSDKSLSELRSALGTLEYSAGSFSRAKKLINKSLISANENVLAQANWLAVQNQISFQLQEENILNNYEALSISNFQDCLFKEAASNAWNWLEYQPFSVEPAVTGSHISSFVSEDYNQALEFIRAGLKVSPDDFYLNNNHAFCLASLGEVASATEILIKIINVSEQLLPRRAGTLFATIGLIFYRAGNREAGKKYYIYSQNIFHRQKLSRLVLTSKIYMAREERYYDHETGNQKLDEIIKKSENQDDTPLIRLAKKIRRRHCSVKQGIVDSKTQSSLDYIDSTLFKY